LKRLLVLLIPALSLAVNLSLYIDSSMKDRITVSVDLDFGSIELGASLLVSNDGKFHDPVHSSYYFGHYFRAEEGFTDLKLENFSLKAGRFSPRDDVESPYSLFLNSESNPFAAMGLSYDSNLFSYRTLWLGLTNQLNGLGFPERGANYRSVTLKLGDIRVGYQEAIVYTERYFDFEYFFNPIPNFFTQYSRLYSNVLREGTNDNSILGFFIDWNFHKGYLYSQILVDDFNMNRFYGGFQNPDKVAWSLGGWIDLSFGKVHLYHAGATKYTFEPSIAGLHDEYFHYPVLVIPVGDSTRMILPEENYVGYKYGENALSFMVALEPETEWFDSYLSLELVLSGAKSPINPWHESRSVPEGTHILDDEKIQKIFRISTELSKGFEWVRFRIGAIYEFIDNPLRVIEASDGDGEMYVPGEGTESEFKAFMEVSVGF